MKKKILVFAFAVAAIVGGVYTAKAVGPDQGGGKCLWPPGGSCFHSTQSSCSCG